MTPKTVAVAAVGEALVDFVAPDAPSLATARTFTPAAGGAPANVAVAAARLGAASAFVGGVGEDPFGDFLREALAAYGVDISGVRIGPARTTLAFVARNTGGIPDFVFYRGADAALRAQDLPQELLAGSTVVHLSSLAMMTEPARGATRAAARLARDAGALVSVDPNIRPSSWPSLDAALVQVAWLLDAADIVKVNDEEARLLTGVAEPEGALARLGRPEQLVVVTLGPAGCLWRWKGESGRVPSPRVEVVDTTGAGDAFVGALLAELTSRGYAAATMAGLSHEELVAALRFASAAAALSCTAVGAMASLPTREQVEGSGY